MGRLLGEAEKMSLKEGMELEIDITDERSTPRGEFGSATVGEFMVTVANAKKGQHLKVKIVQIMEFGGRKIARAEVI